ncbi:type II secretion system protein M [Vibrio plantisponsor]|uniref:Type II secretion system protein M n=1 Tax=Vibrio plantisponsor TaxID=664643 RepID=A0ABU4IK06_9VIBR|nr:type II secretion system protein M [Vibrio plantisponsor]MDW6018609.1 type II secretion system protein M [Vibrio plantisponsor]NNM41367.1 type II secretion system protein M [Vibrio plantisponsor]
MSEQIANKVIAPLQHWWQSINHREKVMVSICALLAVVAIVFWGVLQPLNERGVQAQNRIQTEKQLLAWVTDSADKITALRKQGGVVRTSTPLNQVITSSTRQFKIELIRMQPRGEMMQVWIQPVPFTQLVAWIAYLKEQQGVDVDFMDIKRGKQAGVVEVQRLQLKRGG